MSTIPETAESTPDAISARAKRAISAVLVIYWLALFIGTHTPRSPFDMPKLPKFFDKVMHFGAYAGLAFLFGLWLASRRGWDRLSPFPIIATLAIYGIIDEVLQPYVNRSADMIDWTADVLGACVGVAVLLTLKGRLGAMLTAPPVPSRPAKNSVETD